MALLTAMFGKLRFCAFSLSLLVAAPIVMASQLDCAPYRYLPAEAALPAPIALSFLLEIAPDAATRPSHVLASFHGTDKALLSEWLVTAPLLVASQPRVVITERDYAHETIDASISGTPQPSSYASIEGLGDAVNARAREVGLSPLQAQRLRPWYLSIAFVQPSTQSEPIDLLLQRLAVKSNIATLALEDFSSIARAYEDAFSEGEQLHLLAETLCNQDLLEHSLSEQSERFLRNDVAGFYDELGKWQGQNTALAEKLGRVLVEQRNALFGQTLTEQIRQGAAFIIIGNLHVFGQSGLLATLQRQFPGLKLRAITPASLAFSASSDDYTDERDWLVDALGQDTALAAVTINAVPPSQLEQRLCPDKPCRVEASQSADRRAIEFDYLTYASLRAGDAYARSLLIRELARHALLPAGESDSPCREQNALHEASLLQRRWALQNAVRDRVVVFPKPQACR